MLKYLTTFAMDDDGAVTVDFVVLTAAVIVMCLGMMSQLYNNTYNIGEEIADQVAAN